jgi:ABC-type transport system involved in Fe-S cluster assembly fused permease/ATPase subunit
MRFYDPKNGSISLDGRELKSLNPISYRKHIGIVSQVSALDAREKELTKLIGYSIIQCNY